MRVIGSTGRPRATAEALLAELKGAHWPGLKLVLVAPAGNGGEISVMVSGAREPLLTRPAFGPAFGEEGRRSLGELVAEFRRRGAKGPYEAVLPPGRLGALSDQGPGLAARIEAVKNPADPAAWSAG